MSFYKMHRGWMDNPAFRGEKFTKHLAFCWLIENAAFKDGVKVALPKGEITLERGQLSYSTRYMAKTWKWSEARVRRVLSVFRSCSMIELKSDAGQNVITICNYGKYQDFGGFADADDDAAATQDRRSSDANKKEGNNVNNENNYPSSYAFEGKVIRLTQEDFNFWKKNFDEIPDINAELVALDAYYSTLPEKDLKNWFHRAAGALAKKNAQYLKDKPPPPKPGYHPNGKRKTILEMSDAEYNALMNDFVTSDPTLPKNDQKYQ